MENCMNIGIIGLGYVGLTLAMAAANNGVTVYGVETNQDIKDMLMDCRAHFYEPGLDTLIRHLKDRKFFVVEEFPGDVKYDAFVITVGTPLRNGAKEPDYDYIRSALKDAIGKVYDGTQAIILRSTVSVGTTRKVVIPFLAKLSGLPEDEVLASMCPERTIEGNAVYELTNLPQIISGNNEKSLDIAERLFRCITPFVIRTDTIEEAELIKLYCNTYRDMTFAIGNAFCVAAQQFGVDGVKVIERANQGYSRSNIAKPGFVAGPCLEKDSYILINNMLEGKSKEFILNARQFNESMEDIAVQWVDDHLEGVDDKTVAISGMAFKGTPETSDLRGSSSVYIARKLFNKGYKLRLHDFVAKREDMEALGLGSCHEDIYDACKGAACLMVLNNHKRYASVQGHKLSDVKGFAVFDAWNACTELRYNKDIDIKTIGNCIMQEGGIDR